MCEDDLSTFPDPSPISLNNSFNIRSASSLPLVEGVSDDRAEEEEEEKSRGRGVDRNDDDDDDEEEEEAYGS